MRGVSLAAALLLLAVAGWARLRAGGAESSEPSPAVSAASSAGASARGAGASARGAGASAPRATRELPSSPTLGEGLPRGSVAADALSPAELSDPDGQRARRRAALASQAEGDADALLAASGAPPLDPALLAAARAAATAARPAPAPALIPSP